MGQLNHSDVGVQPGDVLAGKYRVERVLGVGGMGVVVAAHHVQLDEKVALKFLLPEALRSPDLVARFVREARAAVKIKSEHVARVTDVGELENGSPFIVMEYLDGSDLSAWLEQHGSLPVEQAVDFVLQACEAIADAHALGIVHRDLKPANLFCIQRSDGQLAIKVLDFGISKVTKPGTPGHDMTKTSALMGTPFYMSPEQMQFSKGVDVRTDIWSLGVILFELLTGRPPFDAEVVTELAIKVANDPAPLLRALRFDAPPGLEQVIATCLEKDRSKRFQGVGELALALQDFGPKDARISVERVVGTLRRAGLSGQVGSSSRETRAPGSAPAPAENIPQTGSSWVQASRGSKVGSKALAGMVGAVGLGALAVVGARALRNTASSASASAAVVAAPQRTADTPEPSTGAAEPGVPTHVPQVDPNAAVENRQANGVADARCASGMHFVAEQGCIVDAAPITATNHSVGTALTVDQVQSVLEAHQLGLKRTCWDRVQTQSTAVNETLHVVVGPSGQVSSANAIGNDLVVGHCIEAEMKRWSFPGSGEINIPFHFIRAAEGAETSNVALTGNQVQGVLQLHQVDLKHACWDRLQTQSSTVDETVHVVVGPSGRVTSVTAKGNDQVVGQCLAREMKGWSFPGPGEINIPFHFLRQ